MSQSIQIQVTQVGLEQSIAAAMRRVGSSSQINLGTNSKQINALSQPLGRITGQADEFSKSMAAANARVLAFGASASIIAGVSLAMSGLLSSTIKVEKSLVEINAVLGESAAELDRFGQGIFNVAKNTGKSFAEVSEAALELARQGLDTEDTLARLSDAMILSRLSGLDATKSVEGLTAAFNSFKSSGISTADILNSVVAAAQNFAVSEKDIIEGLGRSASVADLAGVSFNELAAIITAIQEKTARGGAVIGNSLKTIFARIQDKAVLSDLQDMGIAVTTLQGDVLPALKILENLAAQMGGFSQIEQADISKKLGGIYQLDKLLAALKDLSSESSVYREALKDIEIAGGSAYKKNAVLNETLASIINKVTVSAEQLGAKLGEIGLTDSLKNLLGFFNSLLEGIQKVLGEESGLGTLVKGLVKGLGNLFAGPGLALFGAIILKLSRDLVQFGFASLKAFFGIGQAAKEVQNVESAISQVLARNVDLQQKLFQLEGNRAGQLKLITGALVEQEALLRRSANISSGLAAPLYNVGVRASDSGLRIKNKAGGYMPAVAKESQAINSGVGGARRGDKPVVMPNFNFGQGKKGTVVAHTGEYVVPNFGGGKGSAIFNRDMVQKMGLPDGARKITASGGLIPNFKDIEIKRSAKDFPSLQRLINNERVDSIDSFTAQISPIEQALTRDEYSAKSQRIMKHILPSFGRGGMSLNTKRVDTFEKYLKDKGLDPTYAKNIKTSFLNLDNKSKTPLSSQYLALRNKVQGALGEIDASKMSGLKLNQGNSFFDLAGGAEVKTVKSQKSSEILKKGINQFLLGKNIYDENDNQTQLGKIPVYLPKGTPLLNSASGFIPNFAPKFNAETVRQYANDLERYKSPTKDFYTFPDGTGGYGAQVKNVLSRAQSKATTNKQTEQKKISDAGFYDLDANALGGILLVSPKFGKSKGSLDTSLPIGKIPFFNQDNAPAIDKNKYIKLNGIKTTNTPSGRDLKSLQGDISQLFAAPIVDLAYKLYGNTFDPASGGEFVSKLKSLDPSKKQQLLPAAAQGDIFEAAGKVALNSFANLESLFGSVEQSRPFDFQDANAMQKMFGVNTKRGEAKRGGEKNFSSSKQVSGIVKKVFNDPEYSLTALKSLKSQGAFNFSKAQKAASAANAAGGFIPNFAKVGDLVKNFSTTLLPKLNISKFSDKRLLEDDSVNLKGNIFQKMFVAKKLNEDNKTYEARIRKQLGYKNSNSLFGKDNSAIDGFKSGGSFLEVKGGKYDDRDVKLKFLRANVENYGTGNPLDVWTKNKDNINVAGLLVHNNEKEKYATGGRTPIKGDFKAVDKIRANKYGRPLRFAAANGFVPNFVNQQYITETLARIKAGTSGFSKQEQETFLSKFGARSTGGKLSIRDVYNKLDGEMGVSQLIDKAYAQAGATASNEDVYRVFENQTKANPYQLRSAVSKLGFVPNFARKELGYGAFGTFSSLGKRKGREGEVGVKAFRADTTDRAVEKEWLTAEYLSKYVKSLEPNLFFPPNLSSYDFAMKKKKVLKPVITDPLAKDALRGEGKADPFGEKILSAAIQAASGVKILDLHGGNYTVNKVAQEAIKAFDFSKSYSGQEAYAVLKRMTGAKFGAFDVGVNSLSETATKNLEIIKKRQLAKNVMTKAGGYMPNFADPLQDAVGREMAAGVPSSQIYVDKNSSLKNAMNPMGLMVANRRDEPAGGFQGINRARKEGANPMTYGAASGFVPNYVNYGAGTIVGSSGTSSGVRSSAATSTTALVDSTQEVVKGNRDMLGIIFGVQAGLSALTGATEGAAGGLGAFTNGLSSAAGTATTALFTIQGLSQAFGGAEKGVGKFLGKLGPYGAAAAFAFAGYQELTKYLDKTNPEIQKAGEAMSRVSDAASKAAINLNTLNPAAQERVKKEAKSIIESARSYSYTGSSYSPYGGGGGTATEQRKYSYEGVSSELKDGFENLIAQARGVGVSKDEIDKLIKTRFESDGKMTADEVEQISNQLSSQISNIAEEGSPQSIIRNLTKEQRQEFASMTPKDVEDNIAKRGKEGDPLKVLQGAFYNAGISGDIARQEAIRKTIELLRDQAKAEAEAQKEAVAQAPIALRQTIKAIQREKLERESIRAIDQETAKARYNSSLLIAGIETDLTLSASERTIKTIEAQAALEKQTAELEAQKTIQEEINKLVAEFSENPAFKQIPGGEQTARSTLNRLTKDSKAQALMGITDKDLQEEEALKITTEAIKGTPLRPVEGAAQALADELLKALNLQNNSNQSLADANKEREKGKELEIAKNKIQEQNNRLLQEAQGRISAIADNYTMNAAKVAGQLRLNSPRQELALAQYNATTQETDPRKLREDQRKIIDEFFQKQVNLQAEQSLIEAEADFIRNLKVEENITRLNDNTKATDENTKALKEFLTVDDSLNNSNEKREISPGYDSQHLRKLIAAEVGGQGQDAQAAFLATIMNRANARGEPIDKISKDSAYYQPLKNLGKFMETPPISKEHLNALLRNPNINLPYQHNVTGGGNADGQRLLQNAGVNYSEAIKSGRAKEIAGEIFYSKPEESLGIRSTGITSRQVSDNTIGIGKGAIDQAKNLSSIQDATTINQKALEYARTVASTEESALGLAEQIKNLAIGMQQIGTEKALSGEENRLKNMAQSAQDTVRSLAYLDKVNIKQSMEQAPSTFAEGMKNGFLQMQADGQNFSYLLGKDIPKMFSDGMSGAINSAIEGTVSLKDGLRSAAYEFVKTINQRMMSNLVDKIVGGGGSGSGGLVQGIASMFMASGGMVNGGSGSKDDVPAMLMGGEYVVNKKAVSKYGAQFLESVNNGTLTGYAQGGSVQRGPQGNFYTPGTFGQGAIEGKRNLLDFATQTGTTGQFDKIVNQSGYQAIDLESESSRLSVSGMRNSPQFEATQAAKGQAFDLYLQQYNAELEAKKAEKEQKKAFRKQLMMLAISAVAAPVLGAAGAGFQAGFKGADGQGIMSQLGAGFKGIGIGGKIGGQQVGGLGNLFSSAGKAFTGDFAGAGNQFQLSQIGNDKQLMDLLKSDKNFASYIDQRGGFNGSYTKAIPVSRASGGMIPSTSGIDTVPAMLSGGEFVMNRSAVQGIGSQNLQSMNSGGTSVTSEETSKKLNEQLLAKLDELISASGSTGDITINVAPSGQSSQENSQDPSADRQQFARKIKDAVLQIINDEKRIGGSLRR
jgi:TP901 family phage tail tape measure protein